MAHKLSAYKVTQLMRVLVPPARLKQTCIAEHGSSTPVVLIELEMLLQAAVRVLSVSEAMTYTGG